MSACQTILKTPASLLLLKVCGRGVTLERMSPSDSAGQQLDISLSLSLPLPLPLFLCARVRANPDPKHNHNPNPTPYPLA